MKTKLLTNFLLFWWFFSHHNPYTFRDLAQSGESSYRRRSRICMSEVERVFLCYSRHFSLSNTWHITLFSYIGKISTILRKIRQFPGISSPPSCTDRHHPDPERAEHRESGKKLIFSFFIRKISVMCRGSRHFTYPGMCWVTRWWKNAFFIVNMRSEWEIDANSYRQRRNARV